MYNAGDFQGTETVMIPFNTFSSNDPSASVTVTDFANTDVYIYKDASLTERSSSAGVAVDIDVETGTGSHWVSIDLSDNTDTGFYAPGSQFIVRIEGVTVDAGTLNAWIGGFSIGKMQTAMTAALVAANLDHLALTATVAADMTAEVADNTILSRIIGNGDTSAFVPSTDGLQLIRDKLTDIETDTDVIDDGTSGLVKIAQDVAAILVDTDVIDDGTSGLVKIAQDVAAILVDTTGLDGDAMRGTDSAALAATALTDVTWTDARAGYIDELAAANIPSDVDAIKAKTDNLPGSVPKNVALNNFPIYMVDLTNGYTAETGLTVSATISKDGGALTSCENSVTEISNGLYKINLTQAEMNADTIILGFTATGARARVVILKTDA